MIRIQSFSFNPFQVNSFILYDESSECIIIDASCYQEEEFATLYDFIERNTLKPVALLNTHGHVDHITGTLRVCEKYGIGLHMHEADQFLLEKAPVYGMAFGFRVEAPPMPKTLIQDGEVFKFGNSEITAFHAPGHSPGSLVYYSRDSGFLIAGDVLFSGSIGRTDLPGGNYNQLIDSIQSKIMILPRETTVYPGHGNATTVGEEMDHNPFLKGGY